jgi:Lrp/AsnC family transcriptional regulator, leucine-responsive regulatory protein
MTFESDRFLDETGWQLLQELQRNARLSYSELGQRVELSAPAVAERIHKMEEAGIITAYRAEVDPTKLGLPITAIIRVSRAGVKPDLEKNACPDGQAAFCPFEHPLMLISLVKSSC